MHSRVRIPYESPFLEVSHGTGGYFGKYELTLAADGWKAAPEGGEIYQYIYDAELADSNSELIPDGGAVINDRWRWCRADFI